MNTRRILAIVAGALVMLGGCGPRSPQPPAQSTPTAQQPTTYGNIDNPTPQPTPQPTALPTEQPQPQSAVIEVTRAIVVTHTVEIVVTATPDIQGFTAPAMMANVGISDEGPQPCPARYWKRGRCTATAAQIEAYASEVQP